MRRRLVQFVLLLPVGAAVMVLIAWGIASGKLDLGGGGDELRPPTSADAAMWQSYQFAGAADAPSEVREYRERGVRYLTMHDLDTFAATTKAGHMLERTDAGWPMFAMHGATFHDLAKTRIDWHGLFFEYDNRLDLGVINLPLRPTWGGFVVNTLLYTLVVFLLLAVMGKLRRYMRKRRGLCPMCKYPIGTNDVCTECGCLLKARASASKRN